MAWQSPGELPAPPTCSSVRRRASCSVTTQVPPSAALIDRLLRPRTTIVPAAEQGSSHVGT